MKKNKVLFVDDEVQVLNSIKRSTLYEDYETFIATNGEKALELMEQNEFCVVVSDMRMPGMDGVALLKKVKEKYPDTIRMVLSGYNQASQILTTINQVGVTKFIIKPWLVEEEFLPAIRECVEYYNLRKEGEELKKALVNRNNAYQNILKVNNDIMNNIQKDISNINILYDNIQKFNRAFLFKINEGNDITFKVDAFNEMCNNLFHAFLGTQPTKNEEFSLSKLLNESSDKLNKSVEFVNTFNNITFKGNYRLISLIILELCTELIKSNKENKILVEVIEVETDRLILTISKPKDNLTSKDDGNLILMICLLNAVINLFNGRIDLEEEHIRLNFNFK